MSWLSSVFGSKPEVAKFRKLDLGKEQSKSLQSNIDNFDEIAKLGELYTKNMMEQQEKLLPGYADTLALGQKSTQDLLKLGDEFLSGELPKDVQEQVQRSSAYQSFAGGYSGSGMSHGLTARDLGLTSLDLMKTGADMIGRGGNSAQSWAAMARGDILNPAASMISPMDTANFDLQNAVLKQQSQQFQFNVDAAPNPQMAGVSNTLMGVLGMYLGGAGGMGGGMGGSSGGGGLAQAGKTSYPLNAGMDMNWYGGAT